NLLPALAVGESADDQVEGAVAVDVQQQQAQPAAEAREGGEHAAREDHSPRRVPLRTPCHTAMMRDTRCFPLRAINRMLSNDPSPLRSARTAVIPWKLGFWNGEIITRAGRPLANSTRAASFRVRPTFWVTRDTRTGFRATMAGRATRAVCAPAGAKPTKKIASGAATPDAASGPSCDTGAAGPKAPSHVPKLSARTLPATSR